MADHADVLAAYGAGPGSVAVGRYRRAMRMGVQERRRRLGVRHALATPAPTVEAVTHSLVALHSTDPASMVLSVLVRLEDPSIEAIERALYDDRSIVRILAMRRTVFAVPSHEAAEFLSTVQHSVAASQYRRLRALVAGSGIPDPDTWLAAAHAAALTALDRLADFTSGELAASDPLLGTRIQIGAGTKYATSQSIASRLLTVMSVQGHVVRTRPEGSWASTRFRWSAMNRWLPDLGPLPETGSARAAVARRWLARFGPARPEDLQWWTGWTKGHTIAALAPLDTVEVDLEPGTGLVLADDLETTPEPAPWIALLPALDPTTMGWKHREWYLGPHGDRLFDTNGNAGPTIWHDGRIVGGWAIRDDGSVATHLLTDIGREATDAIDARAARIEAQLDGVVVKARARGWAPLERELRA